MRENFENADLFEVYRRLAEYPPAPPFIVDESFIPVDFRPEQYLRVPRLGRQVELHLQPYTAPWFWRMFGK